MLKVRDDCILLKQTHKYIFFVYYILKHKYDMFMINNDVHFGKKSNNDHFGICILSVHIVNLNLNILADPKGRSSFDTFYCIFE